MQGFFTKLTPEEAEAERIRLKNVEESLKKDYDEILAARRKHPEEKRYVILIHGGDLNGVFFEVNTRTDAYVVAKDIAMNEDIDFIASKVLVEGITLEKAMSIYDFLIYTANIYNDGFKVSDYWVKPVDTKKSTPSAQPNTNQVGFMIDPDNKVESVDV